MNRRKNRTRRRNPVTKLCIILVVLLLLTLAGTYILKYYFPVNHREIIRKYAAENQLDEALVFAVIHTESRFREQATSPVEASGLMQIMRDTAYEQANHLGMDGFDYSQIFDPEINIRIGTFYLARLIQQFGVVDTALAAYNAGRGNVSRWLENPELSNDGIHLTAIPFPETRNYVERVNTRVKIYHYLLWVDDWIPMPGL